MIFNHNRTENLESRLLDVHNSFMPIRDTKFEKVLNDITDNKVKFHKNLFIFQQNILEFCKEREEKRLDDLTDNGDISIFVEEREFIRKLLRQTNRK